MNRPARERAILHALDAPRPVPFSTLVEAARIADRYCVAADVALDLLSMARRGLVRTEGMCWRMADELGLPVQLELRRTEVRA
jgi:hypothetical protein